MKNIDKIIHKCCAIKATVIENDEKDTGERMLLNFGHTLGHAIEQHYNYEKYSHGEAVAIGMYQITKLSEEKGFSRAGTTNKIKNILIKYKLPYEMDISIEDILTGIRVDKKNLGNSLNLILLRDIGESNIYKTTEKFFGGKDGKY